MLKDFETITEDANDFEINKVIPILVKGLSRYKGKDNAISGSTIIKRLNDSQIFGKYKLNAVKLRKLIQMMRLRGDLCFLCSSSKGYYVANTTDELDDCIESLEQRISQQEKVVKALIWQRNQCM